MRRKRILSQKRLAAGGKAARELFLMSWESASYDIKTLREDRHASEENIVAEATRRRRKSCSRAFFDVMGKCVL